MTQYSQFFQTLHDELTPTGTLGRGTHYSILRAVVFHDAEAASFITRKADSTISPLFGMKTMTSAYWSRLRRFTSRACYRNS